jgi:hypothetical protein
MPPPGQPRLEMGARAIAGELPAPTPCDAASHRANGGMDMETDVKDIS